MQLLFLSVLDESLGLLDHPSLVWFVGRRNDVNLPRFDVEKDQNKDVSKSHFGNDLLRKEITLPHRLRMSLQEFIPSSWSAIGTNVVTVAFENGLDRGASD